MNRTQKGAWYGLYLSIFLLLVPVVDIFETALNPILLWAIGYPLAILMILPLIFINKKSKQSEVCSDERDKLIVRKAIIIAFTILCVILLAAYTISIFAFDVTASLPVRAFSFIIYTSFIIFVLILSIATLIQYRLGGKEK